MNLSQAITIVIILTAINTIYNYKANQKLTDSRSQESTPNKKPLQNPIKYLGTAIFLFPLLGGIWGINYWFNDYNLAKETLKWKKYNGVLVSKSIEGDVVSNHNTDIRSTDTTYYSPNVVYHFTINGNKYKGTNIDFNSHPAYGDKEKVAKLLQSLPEEGANLFVYVNNDLTSSVLKPGTQNMSYFGVLASTPFLLIGLIGLKLIYKF